MANTPVEIEYNEELRPLEDILTKVRRPGDFFVSGRLEIPMPRVEVDSVGVLSFPVPGEQIERIIQRAQRAPYGRGEKTIVDTSVRKVWQVGPDKVRLGGKSWPSTLEAILATVRTGLGCGDEPVEARLYKLLVYDEGGFFKAHRDTEKTQGMFGTLVIALPSFHRGGELVLRHAEREVTVELATPEVSELAFAAFYADCEHEVLPVTQGTRVCLVYNLIQSPRKNRSSQRLIAPEYQAEVKATAEILKQALGRDSSPLKITWLLEHQYSAAGLSFAGLKNADTARAQILSQAASSADCAVHLAVVHIEESGSAEPLYVDFDRRGYEWRDYYDPEEEADGEDFEEDFEVIEVTDSDQYLDQWVNLEDRSVDFGRLPLAEGELLPAGALDDEPPDEQRLTEATGNEGANFERSYHRAVVVMWRRDRYPEVLLQAGAGAVLPYLKERIESGAMNPATRPEVISLAGLVADAWLEQPAGCWMYQRVGPGDRATMLDLLNELGEASLLERFISKVVLLRYDGSENEALAGSAPLLGPRRTGRLFSKLCSFNMRLFHVACVHLLTRLIETQSATAANDWRKALKEIARAIVAGIPEIGTSAREEELVGWKRSQKTQPPNPEQLSHLLDALGQLCTDKLRELAATAIAARPETFDPGSVIIPALELLRQRHGDPICREGPFCRLWEHCAEFLLARSEYPPEPPKDWRQEVKLSCSCEDCRELEVFALNPAEKTHHFRVRKDRRRHLHQTIDHYRLDMTHETERRGSPYTLVCTKTRRTFEQRQRQYEMDLSSMSSLVVMSAAGKSDRLSARLRGAIDDAKAE